MDNQRNRALDLVNRLNLLDKELNDVVANECMVHPSAHSSLISEIKATVNCPTVWAFMLSKRLR